MLHLEHSAILSTFIKLPFVIKIFVLSNFEGPFYTGFTVAQLPHMWEMWLRFFLPGRVAQSVTCLATDACLTAYPGVASSIPVRSHTFVEIDHGIISTVILLPSADFIQEGLLSVTSESMCTNYWLTACSSLPWKKCG